MKTTKRHLLRALAEAAEESVEETIAEASGYASAEVMKAALAKKIFSNPVLLGHVKELHSQARAAAMPKPKPRADDFRKKSGRVQASRLQPRGRER